MNSLINWGAIIRVPFTKEEQSQVKSLLKMADNSLIRPKIEQVFKYIQMQNMTKGGEQSKGGGGVRR